MPFSELHSIVEQYHEGLVVRHAKSDLVFDVSSRDIKDPQSYDSCMGGITSYVGNKSWQLVTYARKSKLTGQNCIHTEWRYLNTSSVKRNLGIRTINDLYLFDPEKHWKDRERFISNSEYTIDRERFGKFLFGIDGRRKLDPHIGESISARINCTHGKAMLSAKEFLSGIDSVTDFKKMISGWKKQIKRRSGTRSALSKRILKVNYKRFLKPLDISTPE